VKILVLGAPGAHPPAHHANGLCPTSELSAVDGRLSGAARRKGCNRDTLPNGASLIGHTLYECEIGHVSRKFSPIVHIFRNARSIAFWKDLLGGARAAMA
jgi:hypothetical protein